jgi:hypothetical protein
MKSMNDLMSNFKLGWENENELPDIDTQEVYDAMYRTSIVNIVRYFPYIEFPSGAKFYLIEIEDKK